MSGFERELRISTGPVVAILTALALLVLFAGDGLGDPTGRFRIQSLGLLLFLVPAAAWLLERWQPWVGKWLLVVGLVVIVELAAHWKVVPAAAGSLALLAIPTGLAAVLISLPAAALVACGETARLLLLPAPVSGAGWGAAGVALGAVWSTFGMMCAAYYAVRRVARWSWDYYRRAQATLEETRDQQAERNQALEDLAHANLQLTRLNILAQGLRRAAEDARTAKEQFVVNVSHELRTPLNMITGFSEMIVQSPETYGNGIPTALLADLTIIHRNAEHLASLIDDVLDLSQVETGQMALTREHVLLQEIVEAAIVAVRPLYDAKGLSLQTDVPDDLPPVFCDRTRVREVVLNLLSNAGRFTESGGVHVRAWPEGDSVVVSVADTGQGIAAEDMGKVFRPFQQLDGSIRRRYGGSGLGLSISKRLVELHGGEIWLESEKEVGTTFFFRLPLEPPAPIPGGWSWGLVPGWEYRARTRPSKAPVAAIRPRLVVLETGNSLQRLLTRYLDGVEIVPATSLEDAVQQLSDQPAQALLVNEPSVGQALQSLGQSGALPQTPPGRGLRAVEGETPPGRGLRALTEKLPHGLPVIVCSVPGIQEVADTLGVSDYLVKPISRDALLAALDRLDLQGNVILVVDDEPEALRLFRRMLGSAGRGYRVLRAQNGQEALDVLRGQTPDVILLDLVMPNMDGFRLLEARSQDPALRDIPVIVVSARDPAGQPIVSDALAVTRPDGLSAYHLLACVEALTRILSPTEQPDGSAQREAPAGSPACG